MKRFARAAAVAAFVIAGVVLGPAGAASAHCVQTPVGVVDLSPGHLAAAGGHQSAIDHSGGAVGTCGAISAENPELNPKAPTGTTTNPRP